MQDKKTLYGLKQSSRAWYERFDGFLYDEGYLRCNADSNVYIRHIGESVMILALYVDDAIAISDSKKLLDFLSLN